MFKKTPATEQAIQPAIERVTSVLGPGINWAGNLGGKGGIRIEGTFEGEISIRGLVVIGETGRLSCQNLRANNVIVAGAVKGNITAEKLEIRSTGRVWGDVVVVAFSTEEGAFLRGQVRMEETVDLHLEEKLPANPESGSQANDDSKEMDDKSDTLPVRKIRKIAKGE